MVASVLFLLLLGIFEAGRIVFTLNSVSNGAREGAHYAALNPAATVYSVTQAISPTLLMMDINNSNAFSLTVSCPTCGTCLPTNTPPCFYPPVTVAVTSALQLVVPLPGISSRLVFTSASTTLVER